MSKLAKVFVIAEKIEAMTELCYGAALLGEKTGLIWAGDKAQASGADTIYYLGELNSDRILEHYFPSIVNLVKNERPNLVIVEASKKGRLVAATLAAELGTSVLTDATEITIDGGIIMTKRMVYGGAAFRTERATGETVVVCVGAGVFEASETSGAGSVVDVPFTTPGFEIKCLEKRAKSGKTANIRAAKKIVAVGRGFAAQEDLQLAEELAAAIGAEVGCTRPIAEEEKWLDTTRSIGVSGVILKPEVYIGIGISGQIQHTVGVSPARTIIAINSDINAPIFKQADYGIVGDLYKVLPALTAMLHNK